MARFLNLIGVHLKNFGEYAEDLSNQFKQAAIHLAEAMPSGRVHNSASSVQRKEDFVRQLPFPRQHNGLIFPWPLTRWLTVAGRTVD